MRLSKNYDLKEFTRSSTATRKGIDNTPNAMQIDNLQRLVDNVLQPVRTALAFLIFISSGFRCPALNIAIGGSLSSDHSKGKAADLTSEDNAKVFHYIKDNLDFDQLIWEFGDNEQPEWVHVSYRTKQTNRRQVLVSYKENGRTKYKKYVVV